MRLLAACALATLLGASAVYAASSTPSSSTSATQPSSASSTASTSSSTSTMHSKSKEACEKEAVAKKLYGKEHDDYVKECRAGKKQE